MSSYLISDVYSHVISFLDFKGLVSALYVSKTFNSIAKIKLQKYKDFTNKHDPTLKNMGIAIEHGDLDIFKHIHIHNKIQISTREIVKAIEYNKLDILKYIRQSQDNPFWSKNIIWAIAEACKHGYTDMIMWILPLIELSPGFEEHDNAMSWALSNAIKNNHIDLFKWLLCHLASRGFISIALYKAASHGYIDVIKHIIANGDNISICYAGACSKNNLDVLKWVYANHTVDYDVLYKGMSTINNVSTITWIIDQHKNDTHALEIIFKVCCKRYGSFHDIAIQLLHDYNLNHQRMFIIACYSDALNIAQTIYADNNVDIHINNDEILKLTCKLGNNDITKWLILIDDKRIVSNDELFVIACSSRRFEMVLSIYSLGVDYRTQNDIAFKNCLALLDETFKWNKRKSLIKILQWFCELNSSYIGYINKNHSKIILEDDDSEFEQNYDPMDDYI